MSERFENGKSVFIWSELNDQYHDEEYTRRFYDAIPTAHRLWDAVIVRSYHVCRKRLPGRRCGTKADDPG